MEAPGNEPVTQPPAWLPALVLFGDYGGDWPQYVEVLYRYFHDDFIASKPVFRGEKLALKRDQLMQGKEATFWHIISEGRQEADRLLDLRRCERIRWPRPVVDHADAPELKVWCNDRHGEERVCLWFEAQDYLVVLARRKGYLLLWTAYPVTEEHRRRKLRREWGSSQRS